MITGQYGPLHHLGTGLATTMLHVVEIPMEAESVIEVARALHMEIETMVDIAREV